MRRLPTILLALLPLGLASCAEAPAPPAGVSPTSSSGAAEAESPRAGAVFQVSVLTSGEILLDGAATTLEELRGTLAAASGTDAEVWYYREDGESDAPELALRVMDAVAEASLPISFSTVPDFSNVLNLNTGSTETR